MVGGRARRYVWYEDVAMVDMCVVMWWSCGYWEGGFVWPWRGSLEVENGVFWRAQNGNSSGRRYRVMNDA